jgi:hypothetical protein
MSLEPDIGRGSMSARTLSGGWCCLAVSGTVVFRAVDEGIVSRRGLISARIGVALGALLGVALTLPFAVAFREAYDSGGAAGLLPRGFSLWLFERGLLGGDVKAVYDRYGIAYFFVLGLVTASLFVLARPMRGGRRVVLAGLVVLCVGIFGDYAVPNDIVGAVGFMLEGLGFLVVAIGVGLVVRERAGALVGAGAAIATFACMIAGGVLTGHVPGGPGLTILVGALTFALLVNMRHDCADPVVVPATPD